MDTGGVGHGVRQVTFISPGGQPEQVVNGVRVIPQTVWLLQELESGHAQSLEEEELTSSPSFRLWDQLVIRCIVTCNMSRSPCLQPSSMPYSSTRMLPRYRKQECGYTWYTLTI